MNNYFWSPELKMQLVFLFVITITQKFNVIENLSLKLEKKNVDFSRLGTLFENLGNLKNNKFIK